MQTELELKAFLLTAAHVGLLHAPDVRTTLVTRLHDVDLVVDKTVVQGALDLTGDFLGLDITIFFKKTERNAVKGRDISILGTYTFIFRPPLLSRFGGLENRHCVSSNLF